MKDAIENRPDPVEGQRVHVYRNLNSECLSVRRDGLVVTHVPFAVLTDCEFRVQPAGLRKAQETGVRNVHAYVSGRWSDQEPEEQGILVRYDPWDNGMFYDTETGREVVGCRRADIIMSNVWVREAVFDDES